MGFIDMRRQSKLVPEDQILITLVGLYDKMDESTSSQTNTNNRTTGATGATVVKKPSLKNILNNYLPITPKDTEQAILDKINNLVQENYELAAKVVKVREIIKEDTALKLLARLASGGYQQYKKNIIQSYSKGSLHECLKFLDARKTMLLSINKPEETREQLSLISNEYGDLRNTISRTEWLIQKNLALLELLAQEKPTDKTDMTDMTDMTFEEIKELFDIIRKYPGSEFLAENGRTINLKFVTAHDTNLEILYLDSLRKTIMGPITPELVQTANGKVPKSKETTAKINVVLEKWQQCIENLKTTLNQDMSQNNPQQSAAIADLISHITQTIANFNAEIKSPKVKGTTNNILGYLNKEISTFNEKIDAISSSRRNSPINPG